MGKRRSNKSHRRKALEYEAEERGYSVYRHVRQFPFRDNSELWDRDDILFKSIVRRTDKISKSKTDQQKIEPSDGYIPKLDPIAFRPLVFILLTKSRLSSDLSLH